MKVTSKCLKNSYTRTIPKTNYITIVGGRTQVPVLLEAIVLTKFRNDCVRPLKGKGAIATVGRKDCRIQSFLVITMDSLQKEKSQLY